MNGRPRSTSMFRLLASLALALLTTACALPNQDSNAETEAALRQPAVPLPENWLTSARLTFERLVEETLPGDSISFLDEAALATLADALREPDTRMRASIWLGRSRDPLAAELLMARLEERELGEDRGADAPDVVSAAGLAEFKASAERAARLSALATGETAHPDLEVRVECARAALRYGDDSSIPFLLSVLLIGTHQGRESGEFWPAPLRSAWARERAAEILAWRAGLENRYSADASIGDREREVARLALQLPTREE